MISSRFWKILAAIELIILLLLTATAGVLFLLKIPFSFSNEIILLAITVTFVALGKNLLIAYNFIILILFILSKLPKK